MTPSIRVSWGEVIDKITILEIKAERLTSEAARGNVKRELDALTPLAAEAERAHPGLVPLKAALKLVNQTLWQIEDDIREKEAAKTFDAAFVALARAVYKTNDQRGRLKQQINALLNSEFSEEKQYTSY